MVNKRGIQGNFRSLLRRFMNGKNKFYRDKDLSISVGGYNSLFVVSYMGTPILRVYDVNNISLASDAVSIDVVREYREIIRKEYFK